MTPYQKLAQRLDALPNGFPATEDGSELRLLEKLFSPEEALLASRLRLTLEHPDQIAERTGEDPKEVRLMLKDMAKRGLIRPGKVEGGLGYGLLPFVVGIYEFQVGRIDAELARLFEDYYQQAFTKVLDVGPQVHRVIPVHETVKIDLAVEPYESVMDILNSMQSWGVTDCICRQQKALIGDPCEHPLDVCMTFSPYPGAFDYSKSVKALTYDEAVATIGRAAKAGLVHSVSNNKEGLWYICNCCTCSCGVLRGMAEMGIANVVASSSFINQVDEDLCTGCETCLDFCQFNALSLNDDGIMQVSELRCVGCGVCVQACEMEAMSLIKRDQVEAPPETDMDWMKLRAQSRGIDLDEVL